MQPADGYELIYRAQHDAKVCCDCGGRMVGDAVILVDRRGARSYPVRTACCYVCARLAHEEGRLRIYKDWRGKRRMAPCNGCGRKVIYVPVTSWQRYVACSNTCRRIAQRRLHHDQRECDRCGKPYRPVRADACYCSTRCRVAAHRARQATKKRKIHC